MKSLYSVLHQRARQPLAFSAHVRTRAFGKKPYYGFLRQSLSPDCIVSHMVCSFDIDLLLSNMLHRHMVQVDSAIDDKQWIGLRQDILIDTDAIQELLEDRAELHVL